MEPCGGTLEGRALVRKILICTFLFASALALVPLAPATAAPPTHGCDQANENDGDPYDSTCDGSASQNGKGDGNATGKPCAGCVGAADNKNPKGQMPNGSDANNGYECDGNQGVGQTNPAHTGCDAYSNTAPQSNAKLNGKVKSYFQPETETPESGPTGGMLLITALGLVALAAVSRTARRALAKENDAGK